MVASRGLMKKSPNTPHETINMIEAWHQTHVQKLDENRKLLPSSTAVGSYKYIRYPTGYNYDKVAEEIGHGARRSAVRKWLKKKFPHTPLIVQQVNKRAPRAKAPAPAPVPVKPAPASHTWIGITEFEAVIERVKNLEEWRRYSVINSPAAQLLRRVQALEEAYTKPKQTEPA